MKLGGVVVAGVVDFCAGREDVDDGEVVALADFVIGLVVGGRDLDTTRAEFRVDGVIRNDGNLFAL